MMSLIVWKHRLPFCDKDWIVCCKALVTHSSAGGPLKWEVSCAFNNASGNDWSNHRARSRHPPVSPILLSHKMQRCQAFTVRASGTCWSGSNVLPRSLFSRSYLGLILRSHLLPRTKKSGSVLAWLDPLYGALHLKAFKGLKRSR